MFLSGGSRRESIPLPFPVARGCPHSTVHGPLPHSQSQLTWVETVSHHSTLTLVPLSSTFMDPCDYIMFIQVIQGNLLVLRSAD